jgi:hypothetical protein
VALRGTFEETEPADLLQILALGGKTGVLAVTHQGRASRLLFRGGDIIHAVDGARQGEEVVLSLLARRAGSFVFTPETVREERTIQRSVPALLLTAAQRMDDLTRANGLLRKPSARVHVREAAAGEPLEGLGEAERQLLGLIDGQRSVGEIVAAAQVGAAGAYAMLAGLIERGIVSVVGAEEEGSPLARASAAAAPVPPGPPVSARRPTAPELREVAAYLRQAVACPAEGGG